tara:strand:+ start:126 stop:731 length:606 start_codon:yes stop_codon:yes gene_type:complete
MPLVYEHEEGFGKLYFCSKCRNSRIDYRKCEHYFETALYYLSPNITQVTTKCVKCDTFLRAHKKKDFNLNKLPVRERYHNPEAPYLIKFHQVRIEMQAKIEELKLTSRKISREWNIQVWYYGYLESNIWRRKREFILKRSGYKCERCGKPSKYVHHRTYERVGYENPEDLMAVCKSCHGKEHSENPGLDIVSQFKIHDCSQ